MKIKKFKKICSNKYKVFFEDKTLILYENVILKYNLLYNENIDSDILLEINKDNHKESIYDIALKYINIRMRSKKEIYEYLAKRKFDVKDIENVIDKLTNDNLINDILFCKCYVNDKINFTNSGIDKIHNDLTKLGIDEITINNVLANIDKDLLLDKLNKVITKELKINKDMPSFKLKNKIITKCINLGYKKEEIDNALDGINIISSSNIKTEYNKLYSKYNKKYEGYKLQEFIKSKLFQKGYSYEEINDLYN